MQNENKQRGASPLEHERRIAIVGVHYENMPIQTYWNFHHRKTESFQIKISET